MADDFDLFRERNDAQRWQAVVSRFNAALAIQQDLQRSIYEEKFDLIRRDNENLLNFIKDERQILDGKLCEALDKLEESEERCESLNNELTHLQETLDQILAEEKQLIRLESMLNEKSKSRDESFYKEEEENQKELLELTNVKQQLREDIRDLEINIEMQKRLGDSSETRGQCFITVPKVNNRNRNRH
jgi:hypothetical protein